MSNACRHTPKLSYRLFHCEYHLTFCKKSVPWTKFPISLQFTPLICIIHTYIHYWPLQPFSQDYGLVSHTTHVVCVNFISEWREVHFNVDSERGIFEKLFHGRFIYSQSVCQKLFHISFWCPTWGTNPGFTSNKPTHYLLDYGDMMSRLRNLGKLLSLANSYPLKSSSLIKYKIKYVLISSPTVFSYIHTLYHNPLVRITV